MKATGKNGRVHLDLTISEAKALMTFVIASQALISDDDDASKHFDDTAEYRAARRIVHGDGAEIFRAIEIAQATRKNAA